MTLLKILISGLENIDQQTLREEQVIFFSINFEPQTARLKQVSLLNSRAKLPHQWLIIADGWHTFFYGGK